MCRNIAKTGFIVLLLSAVGFLVGALLSMVGFIRLWWSFPGEWQPLTGLPDGPREILAIKVPEDDFLLRTSSGELFVCGKEGSCTAANANWSAEARECTNSTRPAVVSLFPVLLSREIQTSLACEVSYTDTGHTIYVIQTARSLSDQRGKPAPHRCHRYHHWIYRRAGSRLAGFVGSRNPRRHPGNQQAQPTFYSSIKLIFIENLLRAAGSRLPAV